MSAMSIDVEVRPIEPPAASASALPIDPLPPFSGDSAMPPRRPSSSRALKLSALVAALLLCLTVASLLMGRNSFSDSGVELLLEAPAQAASGEQVFYTVVYHNKTGVDLSEMSFRLFFGRDTVATSSAPLESLGFTVDLLESGKSGTQRFPAVLIGDKGDIKQARVQMLYKASTIRSQFQKEARVSTVISQLPATITLGVPPSVVSGQNVQYVVDVRNTSEQDIVDAKLTLKYPDGFTIATIEPENSESNTAWNIERLAVGEGLRIRINGTLVGQERETKPILATLLQSVNGTYVESVRSESFSLISSPLIVVSISPAEGREYVSYPGDILRYNISYRNGSHMSLVGMVVRVTFEGQMYDLSGIRTDQGFLDDASKTVVIDASGASELGLVAPGQQGVFRLSVPLRVGIAGQLGGTTNLFVKATATIVSASGSGSAPVNATDSVTTRIGVEPSIAQVLTWEGTGSVPPVVGRETRFNVAWNITNPGNELRSARLVATLAPGVSWQSATEGLGSTLPTYNASTRQVTWDIGAVPFGAGTGAPKVSGGFMVSLVPASNQEGDWLPIMSSIVFTGKDPFTGKQVEVNLRDLTTSSLGSGDGRVVAQ